MRKAPLIAISIVLGLALIAAHLLLVCRARLGSVCTVKQTSFGSVLAEDGGNKIRIFKMNRDKFNCADDHISYSKIFEDENAELGYNFPLGIEECNGKAYLLNVRRFFSEKEPVYEISQLDFGRKKTRLVFSFTESEISKKLNAFLDSGDKRYSLYNSTFSVNGNNTVSLYFAEELLENSVENIIYRCDINGGRVLNTERFAEFPDNDHNTVAILGDSAAQIDLNYRLTVNGKPIADERYIIFDRPDGFDEGYIIAKSLEDGGFYKVSLEDGSAELFFKNGESIPDAGDINEFYYNGSKDRGQLVAVGYDGESGFLYDISSARRVDSIRTESAWEILLHSLLILIASTAAVWLVGGFIYLLSTAGRVSVKFALMIVPVMLLCDFIAYSLLSFGVRAIEEHIFKNSLETVSAQYNSLRLTDGIDGFGGDREAEENVFLNILVNSEYLRSVCWTEDKAVSADVNYIGYVKGSGVFAYASDIINGNYDVDTVSMLPSKTAKMIRSAIESKSDIYGTVYDGELERVILFSPTFFAEDGSVNGVFLFSVSSAEVRYSTDKLLKRLMNYKLVLSLIISLLFTLSAVFPFRGLKTLQKKSADYLSGIYIPKLADVKKRGGCVNEIDVISDKFDELLNSVYNDFNELDNLRKANAAYFSDAILKIFNKKTVNSLKFGESASVNAYCVKAILPEGKYSDFDEMNKLLNALAKSLKENDAFAADVDNTSLCVYSAGSGALNVLFFLRGYDSGIRAAADRCYIDISIVNIGGSMRLHIVREDEQRGEILMNTLESTGASTAITQAAASGRGEFSAICVGMVDNEFIYEVCDNSGTPESSERFANSIRDNLRIGIERYFNGDTAAAREMFVTILKTQQSNSVARYYINQLGDTAGFEENL